jgi:serine/threonine protein kinase HipA of HipAB toxin-antitoxin module
VGAGIRFAGDPDTRSYTNWKEAASTFRLMHQGHFARCSSEHLLGLIGRENVGIHRSHSD